MYRFVFFFKKNWGWKPNIHGTSRVAVPPGGPECPCPLRRRLPRGRGPLSRKSNKMFFLKEKEQEAAVSRIYVTSYARRKGRPAGASCYCRSMCVCLLCTCAAYVPRGVNCRRSTGASALYSKEIEPNLFDHRSGPPHRQGLRSSSRRHGRGRLHLRLTPMHGSALPPPAPHPTPRPEAQNSWPPLLSADRVRWCRWTCGFVRPHKFHRIARHPLASAPIQHGSVAFRAGIICNRLATTHQDYPMGQCKAGVDPCGHRPPPPLHSLHC